MKTSLYARLSVLWLAAFFAVGAQAATTSDSPKAHVSLAVDATELAEGHAWAVVHFNLEDGWHIYWRNPGDSGLEPTISWSLPEGVSAGPIHWPAPHRIQYESLYNYGYEKEVSFLVPLEVKAAPGTPATLHAKVNWLICSDICIPESTEVTATIDPSRVDAQTKERIALTLPLIPTPLKEGGAHYRVEGDSVRLAIRLDESTPQIKQAWWFPVDDGIITNGSDQDWHFDSKTHTLHIEADKGSANQAEHFRGHLKIVHTNDNEKHWMADAIAGAAGASSAPAHQPQTEQADAGGLGAALLAAFLGGLILNIMPCVLPILSLKALAIAKKAQHDPRHVQLMGLAYTGGVLMCFALIGGALIGLQQTGQSVGWGFQLQSPAFVLSLCYLIFIIGLNLSGVFEMPALFGSAGQTLTSNDSLSGSFFTGALATLVATPCTAPFMATAIGVALTQPPHAAMAIFLSLGMGLAFPYLLISFVPALRRLLPKPGNWMVRFRQFLAFPLYATAAWLLWVLVQQSGPMGMAQGLFGLCLIALAVWAIPLYHRSRLLQIALLLLLVGLLVRTIERQELAQGFVPVQQSERMDYYSEDKLRSLLDEKKPVFVYATAAWCITCKVNERVALETDTVQNAMREHNITTLVADWTNRDDAITRYLASFDRNGVPLYVYYAPGAEPVVLPQVLTPELVLDYLKPQS